MKVIIKRFHETYISGRKSFAASESALTLQISRRLLVLGVLLSALAFSMTQIQWQVAYAAGFEMPMLGFRWKIFEIPLSIDSNAREDNREAFREAMNRWFISQVWFIETYGNNTGTPYRFKEVTSGAKVTVTFKVQDQTVAGSAQTLTNPDGSARASFVTIDPFLTGTIRLTTIMHELGHVLGLGHVPELVGDLMHTDAKSIRAPSTLDLYAVWILSRGKKPDIVTLPESIPYQMPPQQVVPEFPNFGLGVIGAVALVSLTLGLVDRRRRGAVPSLNPL